MKDLAVLFDFDGTLFYGTTDINFEAINLSLRDMGREPVSRETANTTVGDKLIDACRRILKTEDEALAKELLEGIYRHSGAAMEKAEIETDCVEMLRTLSSRVKIAVCSNAEEAYLKGLLAKFGVLDLFSYVWFRHDGYDKARAIPEIKKALGVSNAVMVGDRAEDVSSGKANGCITVAIQNDFGARDALGADYDVYSHREMKEVLLKIVETGGMDK